MVFRCNMEVKVRFVCANISSKVHKANGLKQLALNQLTDFCLRVGGGGDFLSGEFFRRRSDWDLVRQLVLGSFY